MRFFLLDPVLPGSTLFSSIKWSLVDVIFFLVWFICPFTVAKLFGRLKLTRSPLSPGHERKYMFFYGLEPRWHHRDKISGMKVLHLFWYGCCKVQVIDLLCWGHDWDLFIFNVIFQWEMPQSCTMFLFPMRTFFPFCLIVSSSLSKNVVQLALQNLSTYFSKLYVKPGIIWASLAAFGSCRSFSLNSLDGVKFVPSGRPNIISGPCFVFVSCVSIVLMYVPPVPVSNMPVGVLLWDRLRLLGKFNISISLLLPTGLHHEILNNHSLFVSLLSIRFALVASSWLPVFRSEHEFLVCSFATL